MPMDVFFSGHNMKGNSYLDLYFAIVYQTKLQLEVEINWTLKNPVKTL
jgi:hypothetical protein